MKLTRRELAAAVMASAAAAAAQTGQPQSSPADELRTARGRVRANSETLARQSLPMSTEPAFRFEP